MEPSKEAAVPPAGLATAAPTYVNPGFRFSPTDEELIMFYLRRKIEGSLEESMEIISEVDICKHEPWDLPAKSIMESDCEWFFFSPRVKKYPNGSQSRRATETGYWKATGKERDVKSGSELIGTKRTLVFHVGRAPRGARTEWIMHEYCMTGRSQDSLVVCRVRKKNEPKSYLKLSREEVSNATSPLCDVGGGSSRFVNSDVPREAGFGSEVQQGTCESGGTIGIRSGWKIGSGSGGSSYDSHSVEGSGSYTKSPKDQSSVGRELHRGVADEDDDYFSDILNDNIINLDESWPSLLQQPSSSMGVHQVIPSNPDRPQRAAQQQTDPYQEQHQQIHGTANRRIRLTKSNLIRKRKHQDYPHHDLNESDALTSNKFWMRNWQGRRVDLILKPSNRTWITIMVTTLTTILLLLSILWFLR